MRLVSRGPVVATVVMAALRIAGRRAPDARDRQGDLDRAFPWVRPVIDGP